MLISKYTNIGGRSNNEDYCDFIKIGDKACLVVCDGLGGHSCGEVASKLVVETILRHFEEKPIVSKDNMESLILNAQHAILNSQKTNDAWSEMKTTLTCVLRHETKIVVGYVGDSRIYWLRQSKVMYESEDHSVPYALYKAGRLKKKEIRTHEDSHVVLRSMGTEWQEPKYDIYEFTKGKINDGILLCTDGFWENILEKDMCKTLKKSTSAQEWLEKMVDIVQKNITSDNHDNYTAIAAILT